MTKVKLNVLFKKMQKDDKKEVLMFHVLSDELPHADELLKMPGTIVHLTVEKSEVEPIGAEFASIQRDSKKTALKFNVKGDTKDKINKLYPFAGENVSIILEPSQMSIDEFYEEPHEGMEYKVNSDGTTDVAPGQLKLVDGETVAE
ncbi:hypothetical protein ACO11K_003637 [Bacillus cytotoxicus]|uniref:hypothetical protein n=1 Tax=Bacillus cereus group TaxID=86661 RepID=UPI001F5982F3|nr:MULTISPECIES: hypothetical protein [Bacillus cereus group]MDH2882478.1 hypothetical protein [Bacillus cytotoxicus]HDR4573340.1 hypothetical protein [Bacillus cytotoxicus]HDR4589372.1 hypothetical protein [Bacillus cytotoxicus]